MKLSERPQALERSLDYWILRATYIAFRAHKGQFRKDGKTYYITHPSRVADAVEPRLKPIAWLHDVVEDTKVTLEDIMKEGFPVYMVEAVDVLTHKDREPNEVYWGRIKLNPDALPVKLADINDNLNDSPSENAKKKYARALNFFGVH